METSKDLLQYGLFFEFGSESLNECLVVYLIVLPIQGKVSCYQLNAIRVLSKLLRETLNHVFENIYLQGSLQINVLLSKDSLQVLDTPHVFKKSFVEVLSNIIFFNQRLKWHFVTDSISKSMVVNLVILSVTFSQGQNKSLLQGIIVQFLHTNHLSQLMYELVSVIGKFEPPCYTRC